MAFEASPSKRSPVSAERDVWLTVPNALTLLRLLAIVPFSLLAIHGSDRAALLLFIAIGLTDALDGMIARRFGLRSKAGRLLDPLADKLFTGVSFVVLSAFRPGLASIPLWVMFAVLARDAFILAGSFVVYSASRNSGFKPSIYGKLNTLIEILVIVCFLAATELRFLSAALPGLYFLLLLSLLLSVGDYLRVGLRMMQRPSAKRG
jgi:cardiolipin synthase (CMP-forming)